MQKYSVYLPIDRQHAIAKDLTLPDRVQGTALFADISGFTPLTEALVRKLGAQRGVEELTRYLNQVYDTLIDCLHSYGGVVITFAGDAITCWFENDDGLQAAASALEMQAAMQQFAAIAVSAGRAGGLSVSLSIKIAIATGPARRFVVGDPKIQLIDVLAGSTLYRLSAADHCAEKGRVTLDSTSVHSLGDRAVLHGWCESPESHELYGILKEIRTSPTRKSLSSLPDETFSEEKLASWILPPVYQRLRQGQGEFLAELRPAIAFFLNFTGIDFDNDKIAGEKLDAYVRWVQQELGRFEGYLLQLIVGDKGNYLYGTFGAPIAHEDDGVRAVSAALNLLHLPSHLEYIKDIKIGISQGRLRTGAYGGSQRRTYSVIGDDVNLAARLMEAAAPGQILTNKTVKQLASQKFHWSSEERSYKAKGKTSAIEVYSPLGLQPRRASRLQSADYSLPMVGRKKELELVKQKIELARQGSGQIIGITGEAGVGKSRFIYEIVNNAAAAGFAYYGGECQSYTIESSYWPWQPVWRSLFNIASTQSALDQVLMVAEKLRLIQPSLLPRLPLLKTSLGIPIPENEFSRTLDAKIRKTSLEALLVDCLRAFVTRGPLLIVLESCQWLDKLSHDLIEAIGHAITDLPIVIILVYRPLELERRKEARVNKQPHFTLISIEKFNPAETSQLIALKLQQFSIDRSNFPLALTKRIVVEAEGNPFYVEELLNYIHDKGFDQLEQQENATTLELPTSLHSLILSRVDQLTEKQQITLKVASVIGHLFKAALLWGMYPELGRPEQVISDLEQLSQLHITAKSQAEPELTYFFQQLLTQQVAYESLPYAIRAMLHQQLASFMENNVSGSISQYTDLLAFHYMKGENWSKALEYNLMVARRNQYEYANDAAIAACLNAEVAIEQMPDDVDVSQQQLECYNILGDVRTLVGQYDSAIESYLSAKKIIDTQPSSVEKFIQQAHLCTQLSAVYERKSEFEQAFEWLKTGIVAVGDQSHTLEASRIYLLGSGLYRRQGKQKEAEEWCKRSLEIARQIPSREAKQVVAQAYYNLGALYTRQGLSQKGIEYCLESLNIFEQIQDVSGQTHAYNNLGVTYSEMGDLSRSEQAYNKGLELTQKIGDIQQAGFFANNVGNIYLNQGEWDKAAASFKRSHIIWKQLGADWAAAVTLSNMAQVNIYQEKLGAAREELIESGQLFKHLNVEDFLSELERRWSEFYLRLGEIENAMTHIQKSLELALSQKNPLEEGLSNRTLGEILKAKRDYEHSKEALQTSLAIFTELKNEYDEARTRLVLGQVELESGNTKLARQEIAKAKAVFEKLGALFYVAQAGALAT